MKIDILNTNVSVELPSRLIVVAEDTEVHNTFPIPLINRLEKHFLGMETMLEERHAETVSSLREWVRAFCHIRRQQHEMGRNFQRYVPEDVFVGKPRNSQSLQTSYWIKIDFDYVYDGMACLIN